MDYDIAALPLAKTLGIELIVAEKGRVVGQLTVREEITTGGHILHGGAYMAFADTLGAIGAVLNLREGTRTTTLESKTNFLGSARVGETITGRRRRCTSAAAPACGRPGSPAPKASCWPR